MFALLRPALVLLAGLTLLTGGAYPLLVTAIAQTCFSHAANGSLIRREGRTIGSSLIGQPFDDPKYVWSRASATAPAPYDGQGSVASNLGPTNPALTEAVKQRIDALQAADPGAGAAPVDLVTASGSGLDPEISIAAALYQARRVARARGLAEERVRSLLSDHAHPPAFGVFGEPRVNVLELNLALDALH